MGIIWKKIKKGDYVYHTIEVAQNPTEDEPFASVDGKTDIHKLRIVDLDYNQIWLDKVFRDFRH